MLTPPEIETSNEDFNTDRLIEYLTRVGMNGAEVLAVRRFAGGHSNLTYLLVSASRSYVLRRAPVGPLAPRAHDVAREYRVLSAVRPFFAPAPAVYHLCDDASVIGSPFFLMEYRKGRILRGRIPATLPGWPEYPGLVSRAFLDCLVELHAVDIVDKDLSGLGRPDKYLERQVRGWIERWNLTRTEEVPHVDQLIHWLTANIPVSPTATLVHNDFKLDNVVFNESDPSKVEALLDWEMATVGDPLTDLGYTCYYWGRMTDPSSDERQFTSGSGWFSRDELIHHYALKTGRNVDSLQYYELFSMFKLATIFQQIYVRFCAGHTTDERFRTFDRTARSLIEAAVAKL